MFADTTVKFETFSSHDAIYYVVKVNLADPKLNGNIGFQTLNTVSKKWYTTKPRYVIVTCIGAAWHRLYRRTFYLKLPNSMFIYRKYTILYSVYLPLTGLRSPLLAETQNSIQQQMRQWHCEPLWYLLFLYQCHLNNGCHGDTRRILTISSRMTIRGLPYDIVTMNI